MTRPRTADGRQAGFTLIEVMIAILLTAIAAIGLMALFRVETRASGFSRRETEAAVLAQDKLEALRTQLAPTAGLTLSETTLDAQGQTGTGTYTRTSVISASGDVYDIQVTVSWDDGDVTRSVVVYGQRGST